MERATSIEELRKSLECPVCWEIPEAGPLYQCENGHTLCSGCNGKVKKLCPVCRVKLPKDRIRNLYAEKKLHTFKRLDLEKSQSGQYSKFLSHLSRCNPNSVLLLEPGHPRNNANNNINGNAQMELAEVTKKPKTRVDDPHSVRRDIEAANDYATQVELPKCVKFCAFVLIFGIVITLFVLMILNSKGYWNTRGLGSPF